MQKKVQSPLIDPDQPFTILYNFRTKAKQPQKPRRKSSACERHHPIAQLTIRTRKMTAEIQLKHEIEVQEMINNEEQASRLSQEACMKSEEDEQFFLQNEDQLENGIPISPEAQKQMLFGLAESSQISTYSKLQKALIGFSLQGDKFEEQ